VTLVFMRSGKTKKPRGNAAQGGPEGIGR
jgi:hypothetical protein